MSETIIFVVDRDRIFEDFDYCDACADLGCTRIALVGRGNHPVCDGDPVACPRVHVIASEVNKFIADNDDMFQYLVTQ